jgi:hypothetical protein
MPGLIDSAPDCVTSQAGAVPDDAADFILQKTYENCAGIMTFGPGTVYGEDGSAAETAYYILTWLGIIAMLVALVAWVIFENRRLISHVARLRSRDNRETPQPGV